MKLTGMDRNALRDQARNDAKSRVASNILLKAIIKQENIEATEEDVNKELEEFAKQYNQTAEEVKKALGENIRYFEGDVRTHKAIDLLYDKANFVAPEKKEEE